MSRIFHSKQYNLNSVTILKDKFVICIHTGTFNFVYSRISIRSNSLNYDYTILTIIYQSFKE